MTNEATQDIRFGFGENWTRYLADISQERIDEAVTSLPKLLGDSLTGKSMIDIGSGSGLFSLAARILGASVLSFDYDAKSVACTAELKRRFFPNDKNWQVAQGSILDKGYIEQLGQFDIVYSWGVLHHTGDMWKAISNAGLLVRKNGIFAIGIYNFLPGRRGTHTWQKLKRWYCAASPWKRTIWEYAYISWNLCYLVMVGRNPLKVIREYKKLRGMSWFRDVTDWLGGYPYEAATAGEILEFVRTNCGFTLIRQNVNTGLGVSEFVFRASKE